MGIPKIASLVTLFFLGFVIGLHVTPPWEKSQRAAEMARSVAINEALSWARRLAESVPFWYVDDKARIIGNNSSAYLRLPLRKDGLFPVLEVNLGTHKFADLYAGREWVVDDKVKFEFVSEADTTNPTNPSSYLKPVAIEPADQ